mgnify:CR=1 FL=1
MPEQHIDNEKIPTRLIGAIVAVGSLAFIGILTETVMTVLFPALMREFHVDTATVQWITTIYLLAVAATMPISSFLKRRFALKTIFLAAVILAIVGSLIMIVAQAFPLLIVARIIQGIGSGVATPLMINIILEQSPRSKIGRLMGVGSLVITVAPAIGPTVGGAVTTVLPWRAIFVIAIPLVLIAACIGMKCIEQKTPTEAAYLDPIQLGSIVVALVGLVLALNQGGVAISAAVSGKSATRSGIIAIVSLIAGLALLIVFAMSSKRAFSPLLRLGILKDPAVLLHACAYLLLPLVAIGYGYVITNVAQLSLGTTAFVAGSLVLPGALVGAVCAPLGGWFYDKVRRGQADSDSDRHRYFGPSAYAGVLDAAYALAARRILFHFRSVLFHRQCECDDQWPVGGLSRVQAGRQRHFQHVSSVWRRCRYRTVLHDSFRGSGRRRRRRHR